MDPLIFEATRDGVMAARSSRWKARALNSCAFRGQLDRVLPGVYARPGAADSIEGKLLAIRAYGDDIVITRHYAAALTWWPELECPAEWMLACPRLISPGFGLDVEQRLITPQLLTRHHGALITVPELTVLDLIPAMGEEPAFEALRRRAITVPRLQKALKLTPKRRGNNLRREVLTELVDAPWSHLEREAHRYLRRARITGWKANFPVSIGGNTYFVDAAFEREKLGIEFDGFEYHSSRDAFEHDRYKDLELAGAGWLMVRFTAETVGELGRTVPELLAARRRQLGLGDQPQSA